MYYCVDFCAGAALPTFTLVRCAVGQPTRGVLCCLRTTRGAVMVKTVAVCTTRGARRRAYTAQPPFPRRTARCLAPSPPMLLTPYDR